MTWASLSGDTLTLTHSQVESERFGVTVNRLTVGWESQEPPAARFVGETLSSSGADLIICRWPSRMLAVSAASARSPRRTLHADTLVYWEAVPSTILAATPAANLAVEVRTASELATDMAGAVREVVRDSFRSYGNHYLANPHLNPEAALAGYVQWAGRTLADRPGDVLLLVEADNRPVGIATLSHDANADDLEVELAGLVESHQGMGLYATLLRACARTAQRRGCKRVIISTQVQNVRVQRAWARAGLMPFAAFDTTHALPAA